MADMNQLDRVLTKILEEAWDTFWKDVTIYLLAAILCLVLITVSLGILSGVVAVGFALLVKERRSGQDAGVGTVMSGFGYVIGSTIATVIITIGVAIGTLFLVLPGLFLAAAWSLTFHAMAYEDIGVGAALSRSYEIFKENALLLIILLIGMGVLNSFAAGFIFAPLLTTPYCMIVMCVAYEKLAQSSMRAPAPHPQGGDGMKPFGVQG